ncbi:MAG: tRNA (N(6)-L-threonylcarbamoyladenosine(37)-C(2))-methylthiotransferase MtaB [Alphaproteobacteria bacterium]
MTAPEIITFGCRLNAYESEVIRSHTRGLEDVVVINTCAVTGEAERQARQMIRRKRRERPGARIIVTGCAAQIDPQSYGAMPEVDQVLGNAEKLDPASYRDPKAERVRVGDIMTVRATAGHLIAGFEGRARAFVQVQNGCDHRCTFCVIPFGRGPSRSVPVGALVEQIRRLVANGFHEVVLTGVDLGAYGADLPGRPALGNMIRRLLAQLPELRRLRLSSIDPVEIDPELEGLMGDEPRLMPHLHLSVQAGDDLVLKRMKRRHSRHDVIELAERLRRRRPDIVFGADLIAGFPTESEAMFEQTLALVAEARLTYLHVFPYSERAGTPAARMPQLPKAVRKERAARLRAAGEAAVRHFLEGRVGSLASVLVENRGAGRSEHFAPVVLTGVEAAPGALLRARIEGSDGSRLLGKAA